MEEIKNLLEEVLTTDFIRGVVSGPRKKGGIQKIKIRPVEINGSLHFQLESFTKTQAFHKNLEQTAACLQLCAYMKEFRQLQIETVNEEDTVLVSKKGKSTIKRKKRRKKGEKADFSHNRRKRYILEEGIPVPFMRDLGVMTDEGKIVRTKTDKFRQINRFQEFIEDILPQLDKDRELTILDFGCGKSYLTFAMYYYLHELKQYDIRIIGLDLKEDVIRHCEKLARGYGYEKLHFLVGDIADYNGVEHVDMVVTLHACDTATDYALAKAVGWDAKVILSVPCCQHELNGQLTEMEELSPILDYGLLKERFAALLTDGLRAKYLESMGYETQVLEFIDMEHTPKNILIRGIKKQKGNPQAQSIIRKCEQHLHVSPTLGKLLSDKRENK